MRWIDGRRAMNIAWVLTMLAWVLLFAILSLVSLCRRPKPTRIDRPSQAASVRAEDGDTSATMGMPDVSPFAAESLGKALDGRPIASEK